MQLRPAFYLNNTPQASKIASETERKLLARDTRQIKLAVPAAVTVSRGDRCQLRRRAVRQAQDHCMWPVVASCRLSVRQLRPDVHVSMQMLVREATLELLHHCDLAQVHVRLLQTATA